MIVTNKEKQLSESKITPEVFAKAIQSLDLSVISDPSKRQRAIIERVFYIMAEEIQDPATKKKLRSELKIYEFHKSQLGI